MLRPRDHYDGEQETDGIIALVKQTADGLGRLIADHIRLARVEMAADAKSYGRQLAVLAGATFVLLFGYTLACIAGALALSPILGGPLAFAAVAALHLALGAVGLGSAIRTMRRTSLMHETAAEVSRSVTVLSQSATLERSRS